MSGVRLTPITLDQPIGTDANGVPVMPTFYFAQMIQRILTLLNEPGAATSSPLTTQASWSAGTDPNGSIVFTAAQAVTVTGIVGRVETPEGQVATLIPVKVPSGYTVAEGTPLIVGSFNANGSATVAQTLTLSAVAGVTSLAAGDSIGIQTTGFWTISTGVLTFSLTT